MFRYVLLLFLFALHVAADCPSLRDAIASWPDYNHTGLGLRWFRDRGFKKDHFYGCRPRGGASGPLDFGLGCSCPSWAVCRGQDLEFEYKDAHCTSPVGECGCCSGWLVAVILISVLIVLCIACQIPFIIRLLKNKRRETRKKRYEEKATQEDEDMVPIAHAETPETTGLRRRAGSNPLHSDEAEVDSIDVQV